MVKKFAGFGTELRILPPVPRMVFDESDFHPHTNLTVRLGRDWLDRFEDGNDSVVVLDPRGKPTGQVVRIIAVYYVPLCEAKPEWLVLSHKPEQRALAGMIESVAELYRNAKRDDRRRDRVSPLDMASFVFFQPE